MPDSLEPQGEHRACVDTTAGMVEQVCFDRCLVDDRVAPIIELYPLRQQLRANAASIAGDRIDVQREPQRHCVTECAGMGMTGVRVVPEQAPRDR
jgi:hypothetical protein